MVINEKLESIIKSLLGNFQLVGNHRNDSERTGVFEIITDDDIKLFVKIHNRLSRWNPEVYAYENWMSILKPYTPKLLHYFKEDDLYGIIVTTIKGKTINEYKITDDKILENAYYKSGELLKKLHTSFQGEYFGIPSIDGSPLEERVKTEAVDYIVSTLEPLLKSGEDKGLITNKDKELVRWCLKNSDVFKDCKPVPTNWDFSPNNWMVDENGSFTGFIDFENMLWGLDIDSFGVVLERYMYNKPQLEKALFSGYGLENSEEVEYQLRIVGTKCAIAGMIYGKSISDNRIYSLSRQRLDKLKKGIPLEPSKNTAYNNVFTFVRVRYSSRDSQRTYS